MENPENTQDLNNNIENKNIVIKMKNAQIARQQNIKNNSIEKEEKIKKIVDDSIKKDLEKIEVKKEKLYKKLSKIL